MKNGTFFLKTLVCLMASVLSAMSFAREAVFFVGAHPDDLEC